MTEERIEELLREIIGEIWDWVFFTRRPSHSAVEIFARRFIKGRLYTVAAESRKEGIEANILKIVSSEWEYTDNPGEAACHSRMIEGVLCRWWGNTTPPGVAIIDDAAERLKEQG